VKDQICRAFCSDLSVREIDSGFAISTPYDDVYGDPIGFYALAKEGDEYTLIDNGSTMAFIEAAGATVGSGTRHEVFNSLLAEYGANYNEDRGELSIPSVLLTDVPKASLRFMALLLRLKDLLLLTRERVESTFREDVITALREKLRDAAVISEDEAVSERLLDVIPDLVLRAPNRDPVALFIATSDQKVSEAIYLQMAAQHEAKTPLIVVAMLEHEGSVKGPLRQRADNRLDAVPRYRKDEHQAIDRVVKEVIGRKTTMMPVVH
jgi:hypothetical protein